MHRIGNDIVDLNLAATESNWQRKGFLDKVFTDSEQEAIQGSENPFDLVWRMWSMKESAYKVYTQETNERFFNPKKLVCTVLNSNKGLVIIDEVAYFTKTVADSKTVFTSAFIDKSITSNTEFFRIDSNTQTEQIHSALIKYVSVSRQLNINELTIKKTLINIPKLYYQNKPLLVAVSFTHHGNFGAYSIVEQ